MINDQLTVRLVRDGTWEPIKNSEIKKGDIFLLGSSSGPQVWVAIKDAGDTPQGGLRCEPLSDLQFHLTNERYCPDVAQGEEVKS